MGIGLGIGLGFRIRIIIPLIFLNPSPHVTGRRDLYKVGGAHAEVCVLRGMYRSQIYKVNQDHQLEQ